MHSMYSLIIKLQSSLLFLTRITKMEIGLLLTKHIVKTPHTNTSEV